MTMPSAGQRVPRQEQEYPGRTAHPGEIAPSYVFFASGTLSGHYSGEALAPIGGETVPG